MSALEVRSEPSSLIEVFTQCDVIEAWAASCDSVAELKQSGIELGVMDDYLARTSTEGRARVQATMRRLEVRIGQLLPVPKVGNPGNGNRDSNTELIERHVAHDMREMAEHPDLVEEVIAASTDEAPASRRKVTEAIKSASRSDRIQRISDELREIEEEWSAEDPEQAAEAAPVVAKPSAGPRRRPWCDAYSDAVSAVEKATATLKNLASDDRAAMHSEQAIGRTNDLLRAIDALAGVATQLS
jgi:sugar phosphate isomerase/epimerase